MGGIIMLLFRRFCTLTSKNSNHNVNALRQHILNVAQKKIVNNQNHVDQEGIVYISTKGWSIEEVQQLRTELGGEYHIMNCNTFKAMRLEPLNNPPSETRKMFP